MTVLADPQGENQGGDRGRSPVVTDEMRRILRAIAENRMTVNSVGRYLIEGESRPDRRSRELLRGRGLIEHRYEMGRGSYWRITAKGKAVLRDSAQPRPPSSSGVSG